MSFTGLNRLGILGVSKDKIGRYVKLRATLSDGTLDFRCELDALTYKYLRESVSKKYFDSLASGYHYDLILIYQQNVNENHDLPYKGLIRCTQGNRSIQVEFPCSERFAGNIGWFTREVKTIKDIQHLEWTNFSFD